jgi:hypothetical protein
VAVGVRDIGLACNESLLVRQTLRAHADQRAFHADGTAGRIGRRLRGADAEHEERGEN